MAPEYGATCGFFPIDPRDHRLSQAHRPRRGPDRAGAGLCQGAGHVARRFDPTRCSPTRSSSTWRRRAVARRPQAPAGPRRAAATSTGFDAALESDLQEERRPPRPVEGRLRSRPWRRGDRGDHLLHQHLQPERADRRRPAGPQGRRQGPYAQALGEDLAGAGQPGGRRLSGRHRPAEDLDKLGFNLVGFGCTTCIGNSGPLPEAIFKAINDNGLVAAAVLSGNRNFEGRVSPDVQANYLASPPLVVAYALAGSVTRDLAPSRSAPARTASRSISKDIWPTTKEIRRCHPEARHPRRCSAALCRRVQGRRPTGARSRRVERDLSLEHDVDLCAEPALLRGHEKGARADRRHRRRARWRCSATRSPPTTSRRPARSS